MRKVNFSGGEPFIHQKGEYLGQLVRYCKEELELESVSIVSNGSLIKEEWFQKYGTIETDPAIIIHGMYNRGQFGYTGNIL